MGGHREDNETALETAKREVYEESQIDITPFHSNTTFHLSEWNEEPTRVTINEPIAPILIKGNEKSSYTVMYLSKTLSMPTPSSESKGLLLISPENVQLLCQKRLSLHEYQKLHGISILTPEIDTKLILQPFP